MTMRHGRIGNGIGSLAAGLLLALAFVAAPRAAEARPGVGDRAIEFVSVKDDKGRKVRIKAYKDRWIVLTVGASWCKPCKKELPAWDKLAAGYEAKGVLFVALNGDGDTAKGKKFMSALGLKHMLKAYDPEQSTIKLYDPPNMPTTYVIDPKGVVRHVHATYSSGDEAKLAKVLDGLLSK
jgi:cytochrome c biogenesis protein CcmG, thiol:disulfide interchange protein DsbE